MDEQKSEEHTEQPASVAVDQESIEAKKEAIEEHREWVLIILGLIVALVGVVMIMKFQYTEKNMSEEIQLDAPDPSELVATPPPPPFSGSTERSEEDEDEPSEV